MTDLSATIATILGSSLADPEAIKETITSAEADLQSLETQLAEAEGKALADTTAESEVEVLASTITTLTLRAKRRSLSLDKLRTAHTEAIKAKARAEREEKRRQV